MLLTSSWLERVEGGPEPGSVDHLVRVPRVPRVCPDRGLQTTKQGKAMRPVALKQWSVLLFHEIMATRLEKVDLGCLFSKRRCQKNMKWLILCKEYHQINFSLVKLFSFICGGGHTGTP